MKTRTPDNISQYQKHYSEKGLFAKISKVCRKAGLKGIYYMLLLFYVLKDDKTSLEHKAMILGALGYFILPIDMLPDFIPVIGFSDDIAAIIACVKTVKANITPEIKKKAIQKLYDWFADIDYRVFDEFDIDNE